MGMEVKRKIQLRAGEATIKNISLCRDERNKELSGFRTREKRKNLVHKTSLVGQNKTQEIVETSSSRTSRVLTCEKKKCR